MKRKILFLTLFLLSILCIYAQSAHYYYKGGKFYLPVDFSRISVISEGKMNDTIGKSLMPKSKRIAVKSFTQQNVLPFDKKSESLKNEIYITEIDLLSDQSKTKYDDIVNYFQKKDNVVSVLPTYIVQTHKLGISNNFYVKIFNKKDESNLVDLAVKYSIKILGYNEFMPLWFTLSCTKKTGLSSIDAANMFYETGMFECAEPELLYHDLLLSNDNLFSNQWNLKNTGQHCNTSNIDIRAENAWAITTGNPEIKVAVFDHGFEMNHPDLQNNVYGTGYDATTGTVPAQVRGNHGTACAGIVSAVQNNSIGISGVSPSSKLMSISINLFYSDTPQQLANGFNWAWQNGADIISNSWGGYAPSTIIDDAISLTLSQGRNGKGSIVVFAAGNENNTNIRYPGNSNSNILVVGAISPSGERKSFTSCDGESWGSCYGTQLDIMAPGVLIPTTDRQGNSGYSLDDYVLNFNGTSSACPHIGGVAALVLSANSSLTGQQVRNIIESTAQKVGGYNYQTIIGRDNGTWNTEMGYGLVDTYAAVQAACATPYSFTDQTVSSDKTISSCGDINVQNVNVQNGAKLTLDATGSTTINSTFEVQLGSEIDIY